MIGEHGLTRSMQRMSKRHMVNTAMVRHEASRGAGNLEDPVNAGADVGEGFHEGVETLLAHSVEGMGGGVCLLLGLLQLLHTPPLSLLHKPTT